MTRYPAALLCALLVPTLAAAESAPDCRAIAAATVAELRAGYTEWNDAAEQLARAAAGAACVKATSASPAPAATGAPSDPNHLSSTPVRGASSGNTDVAATGGDAEEAAGSEEAKSESSDEAWNPFSELKFNKVSASPSKKPYERRRSSEDED